MAGGGGTTGTKPTPLLSPGPTREADGLIGGGVGEGAMLGGCCCCCGCCCCALTTAVPIRQSVVSALVLEIESAVASRLRVWVLTTCGQRIDQLQRRNSDKAAVTLDGATQRAEDI